MGGVRRALGLLTSRHYLLHHKKYQTWMGSNF